MKFYVRNIKKGFATNSSSYHSTLIHYIDIPEEVWVEFQNDDYEVDENNESNGYIRSGGIVLLDDEGYMWRSIGELDNVGYSIDKISNGKVRITVETTESERENLK